MDTAHDAVVEAVAETMEALAFMDTPPVHEGMIPNIQVKHYWSHLTLDSPLKGHMVIEMPEPLLIDIEETVFGGTTVEEVSEERNTLRDIMGEILNTLAGNVLKRLVPPDETFTIGLPETGEGYAPIAEDMEGILFHSNEQVFCVRVVLED